MLFGSQFDCATPSFLSKFWKALFDIYYELLAVFWCFDPSDAFVYNIFSNNAESF